MQEAAAPGRRKTVDILERLIAGIERINRGDPYIGSKDLRDARAILDDLVGEREEPPIAGMWVVESAAELTSEIVDRVKDKLLTAFEDGEQIMVSDGIEFRWRPTRIDPPGLDVERLVEAARIAGRNMSVPLLANPVTWRAFAEEVAETYRRLSVNEGGVASGIHQHDPFMADRCSGCAALAGVAPAEPQEPR